MKKQEGWDRQYHRRRSRSVHITARKTRIIVVAPFSEEFRQRAHTVYGAEWKQGIRAWAFPLSKLGEVRNHIGAVYGIEAIPQWMREAATDGGDR